MGFERENSVRKWRNTRGFEVVWMGLRAEIQDGRPDRMGHVGEAHWREDGIAAFDGSGSKEEKE